MLVLVSLRILWMVSFIYGRDLVCKNHQMLEKMCCGVTYMHCFMWLFVHVNILCFTGLACWKLTWLFQSNHATVSTYGLAAVYSLLYFLLHQFLFFLMCWGFFFSGFMSHGSYNALHRYISFISFLWNGMEWNNELFKLE